MTSQCFTLSLHDALPISKFMQQMNEKGWIGAKAKQGFYLKKKGEKGSVILQLNPETMEYEDRGKLKTGAVEMAKQQKGTAKKIKALVSQPGDKASDFLWNILSDTLVYSANLLGEIADDIVAIDNAMKWGFGWRVGPFETWDAIGVRDSVNRMKEEGVEIPEWVTKFLDDGNETFYKEENNDLFFYNNGEYQRVEVNKKEVNIRRLKADKGVIKIGRASCRERG